MDYLSSEVTINPYLVFIEMLNDNGVNVVYLNGAFYTIEDPETQFLWPNKGGDTTLDHIHLVGRDITQIAKQYKNQGGTSFNQASIVQTIMDLRERERKASADGKWDIFIGG